MQETIKNIKQFDGKSVTLKGWLYNKRSSGKIAFLQFRDGTGTIQGVVVKSQVDDNSWQAAQDCTYESSCQMIGLVKADNRAPSGFEIEVESLSIIQLAPDDYPIGKKEHGTGFLLENRHFWLRTQKQRAIQVIRDRITTSINDWYHQNDFIKIDTPIFTPNACEGTTELFEVDYFGEPAYLSQSGQLYLEAMLPNFRRVYDFAPVFRAEKSKTRRHLTEFWMTNAEAAFVDHDENLKIQENIIYYVIQEVLEHNQQELAVLERDIDKLKAISLPFDRLTHEEAVDILREKGSEITKNDDLGAEDESLLVENHTNPVFVQYYPANVKAFYMKRWEEDESKAKCADLIAPEGHGEVIGGSERETDYETLMKSVKLHQLPQEEFQWYLDQRRYGSVPHSGFGIGLERLVKWMCGLHHVRETIPFPRMINRLRP